MARSAGKTNSAAFLDTEALRHLVLCPALAAAIWSPRARKVTVSALTDLYGSEEALRISDIVGCQVLLSALRSLSILFRKVSTQKAKVPSLDILDHVDLVMNLQLGSKLNTPAFTLAFLEANIFAILAMLLNVDSSDIQKVYRNSVDSIRRDFASSDANVAKLRAAGISAIKDVVKALVKSNRKGGSIAVAKFYRAHPVANLEARLKSHRKQLDGFLGELWIQSKNEEGGKRAPKQRKPVMQSAPDFFSEEEAEADLSYGSDDGDSIGGHDAVDDGDGSSDFDLSDADVEKELEDNAGGSDAPAFANGAEMSDDSDLDEGMFNNGNDSDVDDRVDNDPVSAEGGDNESDAAIPVKKRGRQTPSPGIRRSKRVAKRANGRANSSAGKGEGVRTRSQKLTANDSGENDEVRDGSDGEDVIQPEVDKNEDWQPDLARTLEGMASSDFTASEEEGVTIAQRSGNRGGKSGPSRKARSMRRADSREDGTKGHDRDEANKPAALCSDGGESDQDEPQITYAELRGSGGETVRSLHNLIQDIGDKGPPDPLFSSVKEASLARRRNRTSIERGYSPHENARAASPIPESEVPRVTRKKKTNLSLPKDSSRHKNWPGTKVKRIGRQMVRSGRFSVDEDNWLREGLKKFGWGSWERIASAYWTETYVRTAMSLKDRARTLHLNPDDYPLRKGRSGRKRRRDYNAAGAYAYTNVGTLANVGQDGEEVDMDLDEKDDIESTPSLQ